LAPGETQLYCVSAHTHDTLPIAFPLANRSLLTFESMSRRESHFFTLHELMVMAALAALGGVSSSALSWIRMAVGSLIPLPGAMQWAAGLHTLWLVLAVGLIRKPGAATVCGLLKGAVELLTGNPLGLIVVLYSGLGGVCVDIVWLVLARGHHPLVYCLAGGVASASNVLVLKFIASLHADSLMLTVLAALALVAFASGFLLAGLLGWWLLRSLYQAGVVGVPAAPLLRAPRRTWLGIAALAIIMALFALAGRLPTVRASVSPGDAAPAPAGSTADTVASS
jgi:energy-coupling factor transport system substrate-specific component